MRLYQFKMERVGEQEFSLSTLLEFLQVFARADFHTYSVDELRLILRGHGLSVGIELLQEMVQCLIAKGFVEHTVSGYIQLTGN